MIAKQRSALQVEFITGVKLICYFVLFYCFLHWAHPPNMAVSHLDFYYTLYLWVQLGAVLGTMHFTQCSITPRGSLWGIIIIHFFPEIPEDVPDNSDEDTDGQNASFSPSSISRSTSRHSQDQEVTEEIEYPDDFEEIDSEGECVRNWFLFSFLCVNLSFQLIRNGRKCVISYTLISTK